MQDRVRAVILAQPAVEGAEGMGRGKAALEQQPHRIAFIAEAGLHADEDISEMRALDQDVPAIGQLLARGGAPCGLDFGGVFLAPHMLVAGMRWATLASVP
jgi:hypothetical protein